MGEKQVCPSCAAKFYDLGKRPATCPKCSTAFDPAEEGVRSRRGRGRVAAHDPAYDEDDEDAKGKKKAADGDEDEEEAEEETAEVDAEGDGEVVVADDDEDDAAPSGDELPEGFNEEDPDLEDAGEDDDSVPLIEDEEEFPEDEIGDLPNTDDEER